MEDIKDEIKELMDEYLLLADSAENRRRLQCWEPEICARDQWHGRARQDAFRSDGAVPLTIDLQHPLWLQIFPQDLARTFTEPAAYLRFYLQKRTRQFKEFQDDTPLEPIIPIWMHTPFEMSLFEMPYHHFPDKDPLIEMGSPVCRPPDDLANLPPINFFKSGMMPLAHRIYEGIQEIAGESFNVLFPEWIRGPFGVTMYIGGYQDMLMCMVSNPDFFHALMRRTTDERMNYFKARADFLGETQIPPASLFNDEVDAGIIGPMHYHTYIKPYEMELGQFHGRISYWHSCGDTWPMAGHIADMDCVDVLDVSGFTDLEKVLSSINGKVPRLDIRLHPIAELQDASEDRMEQRMNQVIALCRGYDVPAVSIRVSGLNPWKNPQTDFARIKEWISIARRVVARNTTP